MLDLVKPGAAPPSILYSFAGEGDDDAIGWRRAMRRILSAAIVGWAAIVALAWWLANGRIAICYATEDACKLRATATRDDILVRGLGFALAALLLFFVARAITTGSRHTSERLVGIHSPRRSADLVKALRVRSKAIRYRRWLPALAAGAGALIAVLGWNLWGEQSDPSKGDPYAAFSRKIEDHTTKSSYDDLIPPPARQPGE